jgi:hypothetical protein
MIYGYDSRTLNDYGLKQLREISLAMSSRDLRDLADFLREAAEELEGASSAHWHLHAPDSLQRKVGCDVVILNSKPSSRK